MSLELACRTKRAGQNFANKTAQILPSSPASRKNPWQVIESVIFHFFMSLELQLKQQKIRLRESPTATHD